MKALSTALRVFGAPAAIGVLTVTGLTAALLWGERGLLLAWVGVGSPVIVVALVLLRLQLARRRTATSPAQCRRR